jgi:hypothetical protein
MSRTLRCSRAADAPKRSAKLTVLPDLAEALEVVAVAGVGAEDGERALCVQVESVVERGEEGGFAGQDGCHAQFDLAQVEGDDAASLVPGFLAVLDDGGECLGSGVLAGDAGLDGAALGAGVLGHGRDRVPGGIRDADAGTICPSEKDR